MVSTRVKRATSTPANAANAAGAPKRQKRGATATPIGNNDHLLDGASPSAVKAETNAGTSGSVSASDASLPVADAQPAQVGHGTSAGLSEFERQREETIRRNREMMMALNLPELGRQLGAMDAKKVTPAQRGISAKRSVGRFYTTSWIPPRVLALTAPSRASASSHASLSRREQEEGEEPVGRAAPPVAARARRGGGPRHGRRRRPGDPQRRHPSQGPRRG